MFLRYPNNQDFSELAALYKSSRKLFRGLVTPPKTDRKSYDAFLERNESETTESFLICRQADGAIVGTITLSQIFRGGFQNAYLGYLLGEKFTGKGFMTEAVELILQFAFRNLKLHRVEANVQPHNLASIAVLKRCGFTKEGFSEKYLKISGRWRDHERFAITRENWKNGTGNGKQQRG